MALAWYVKKHVSRFLARLPAPVFGGEWRSDQFSRSVTGFLSGNSENGSEELIIPFRLRGKLGLLQSEPTIL